MVNKDKEENKKSDREADETASVLVSSHVKVEDVESGHVIINQRG